jgi:hypothetical protein
VVYDDIQTLNDGFDRSEVRPVAIVPIEDHGVLTAADTRVGWFNEEEVRFIKYWPQTPPSPSTASTKAGRAAPRPSGFRSSRAS